MMCRLASTMMTRQQQQQQQRCLSFVRSHSAAATMDRAERIRQTLATALKPTVLDIVDISGGCGQSFHVRVHSAEFHGKSLVKQHQVVNTLLKDEIAAIHALQLETKSSSTAE